MDLKSRGIFKKFLPVFLLLIVIVAICVPFREANAAPEDIFKIGSFVEDWIAKLLIGENPVMRGIYLLMYQVLNMGLLAVTILVYFGAWLVDVFLDETIYTSVLNMKDTTSAVYIGWTTVRDACNTFFILFLLLIAFSTILRIQTYNAKSLLPKFIISLFLINFSAVIAMMVIDFGQVFMFGIKDWMGAGGFSGAGSSLTSIVDYFNSNYNIGSPTGKFLLEDVVGVGFAVAYSTILGLLYIMLALFLMVRIIVFVILVIISPFAFFSIILPGMRTYTSQWWSSLISHAIFGPIFLFFIFLSGRMAQSMHGFISTVSMPEDVKPLSFIIAELIPHVVALGMLAAAIPVTQKLGVAGAGKIMGGAAGIGKIAVGTYAGIKLAGGLGKKAGGGVDNRIMKGRVSDWGRKKKENILKNIPGGLGKGSALKSQAETERKKEDKMKTVRLEFGEAKSRDLDLLQQKANGKLATKEDKALFAETAAAQGKMGDATYAGDIKKFMPELERTLSGNDLNAITDKNLSLVTETTEAKNKINNPKDTGMSAENKAKFATASNAEQKEMVADQIRREKMNDLVESGETHKLQDFRDGKTTKIYDEVVSKEQKKSDANRMSKKQRDELSEGYMENTLSVADYATATADQKKDDLKYKTEAVNVGKELTEAFASGGADAAADIAKAFSKFDSKRIAKFTEDELRDHGHAANSSQIRSMNRDGKQDELEIVKIAKETKRNTFAPGTVNYLKYQKDIDNIESMIKGDKY
jgi:hypothetical protein